MKIYLDRSVCKCWEAACEQDFTDKYLGKEIKPTACTVAVVEDEKEELVFFIKDRDGTDKEFTVNDDNFVDAVESWMLAYAKQVEEKESA
jgi:hypothetical protein